MIEIKDISRVQIKQGDRLIVKTNMLMSEIKKFLLVEEIKKWAGGYIPIIILDSPIDISVVSTSETTRYLQTEMGAGTWVPRACTVAGAGTARNPLLEMRLRNRAKAAARYNRHRACALAHGGGCGKNAGTDW